MQRSRRVRCWRCGAVCTALAGLVLCGALFTMPPHGPVGQRSPGGARTAPGGTVSFRSLPTGSIATGAGRPATHSLPGGAVTARRATTAAVARSAGWSRRGGSWGYAARPARLDASGPARLRVVGPTLEVSDGAAFRIAGVELSGLAYANWRRRIVTNRLGPAQIAAARRLWHANTVRVQLAPALLLAGHGYDHAYMSWVDRVVHWATVDGLYVILTEQTEKTTNVPMPATDSLAFWHLLATRFAGNPHVMFDLFNEPRLRGLPPSAMWGLWQHGGDGYVGMQQLVDEIRRSGARNVVLAEGIYGGESLRGLPGHLLTGSNIVYSVHPYWSRYDTGLADWRRNFGFLAGRVPLVVGEWGEYQSSRGECTPSAAAYVPALLRYVAQLRLGLVAWAFLPGVLFRGWDYAAPTALAGKGYTCTPRFPMSAPYPTLSSAAQGAGADILRYFASYSGRGGVGHGGAPLVS